MKKICFILLLVFAGCGFLRADENQCGICLSDIRDGAAIYHCTHVFCADCVAQWMGSCPTCRAARLDGAAGVGGFRFHQARPELPLYIAAENGRLEEVQMLVEDSENPIEFIKQTNADGWTALNRAAWAGKIRVVNYLLNKVGELGGNPVEIIDTQTIYKCTPLRWAVENKDLEMVILLLDEGLSAELIANCGCGDLNLLQKALLSGSVEIVRRLIDALPAGESRDGIILHENFFGETVFHMAAIRGDRERVAEFKGLLSEDFQAPAEFRRLIENVIGKLQCNPIGDHGDMIRFLSESYLV